MKPTPLKGGIKSIKLQFGEQIYGKSTVRAAVEWLKDEIKSDTGRVWHHDITTIFYLIDKAFEVVLKDD